MNLKIIEIQTGFLGCQKCKAFLCIRNMIFRTKNGKDAKDFYKPITRMSEGCYAEMEKLCKEDKFKKIKLSSDFTDTMSDFSDK